MVLNIRDIKLENKKNNHHTKHRRVVRPGIRLGVNLIVSACYDVHDDYRFSPYMQHSVS